jgi:site-specific DNA-methyltransferase (adenine-specific)
MIALLPEELWSNPDLKILDPCTRSGRYLTNIGKLLLKGLEKWEPDKDKRLHHILHNMLFGVSTSDVAGWLTRRELYGAMYADKAKHAPARFKTKDGNIISSVIGKDNLFLDDKFIEKFAALIGRKEKDMKFDVIIGNPPYQISDGGFGDSAAPIFDKFIQKSKQINSKYVSMVVPARWYSGGKGLDTFRDEMLHDNRISEIHDFPETIDCFPGQNIRGGICYFLWDYIHTGSCKVFSHKGSKISSITERPLLESDSDIFIRYNEAISILTKVRSFKEEKFGSFVSSRKPFGLPTNFSEFNKVQSNRYPIKLYRFGETGYIKKSQIIKSVSLLPVYKLFVAKASPGGDYYPHQVFSRPILGEPNTACTETYLVIGPFKDKKTTKNVQQYILSRFFRFLVLLIKNTQDVPKKVYSFVPMQDFSEPWTDEKLYKKYGLTKKEIDFIESMIRPME